MTSPTKLVLLHTMDPRGQKLGGIETHVRQVLEHHPEDMAILFVGIDERGDLTPGRTVSIQYGARSIAFLPVAHVGETAINHAAKSIGQSTTMRYALGLLRHAFAIHRATSGVRSSCEIERFEFALLPKLLGIPLVVLVHNEGTSRDEMDSLLKKYWFLHLFNERVALTLANRIFAVNASIKERIAKLSARSNRKTEVMSVSVDRQRYRPSPFAPGDELRICFAGRLDAFKDPGLMFALLGRLSARLAARPVGRFRRLMFDYVGASDPTGIAGFEAIAPIVMRHGIRTAPEVAAIMSRSHAGIITSFFEGLPCYLLEMIASGRPVGAIRLPQFAPLIVADRSGFLVDRQANSERSADALVDGFLDLAERIDTGAFDPQSIAALSQPYSVEAQMHRLFDCHRALALGNAYTADPEGERAGAA